jgi:hypothetical protein
VELSQEIDMEGRIIGGEELEWDGSGDAQQSLRKSSISSNQTQMLESEVDEDDGMEMT